MDDRPPTRGKRFWKLAGMTASVAGRYAGTRLKGLFQSAEAAAASRAKAHLASGGTITKTLGELKGAVMKVGQMASIAADVLPEEVVQSLRRLQKEAPPMAYEVIADQVESELGQPPERLFDRFDREPFASASIGQVHRARTDDGREVVVKVQYPGVDRAVDSDLLHLKLALRASGLVRVGRESMDAVFQELRARLSEELDYTLEAGHVRRFRSFHARHPWIAIPEVVGERSAKRVLTLTYVDGDALPDLRGLGYTQEERDLLGERLLTFVVSQIFEHECIHGDPHPGNFAFRRDGTLVVYDFGCIKVLPSPFVQAYRDTIVYGLEEDWDRVEEGLQALGVRRVEGPPVDPAYYKRWRDLFAEPFLDDATFDFGTSTIHDLVIAQIPGVLKRMTSFKPCRDVVILDRAIAGHYGNLCALGCRMAALRLIRPFLEAYGREAEEEPAG